MATVNPRPGWDVLTVLVTVKAYPAISRKYGESVCVAGVRLDSPHREWVRLFPVGFRALPREKQFAKYRVIRLRAQRASTDRRPESFKPDLDSLVVGEHFDSERSTWRRRWEALGELAGATTACSLRRGADARGQAAASLGLVKPRLVRDVIIEDNPDFQADGLAVVDVDLFGAEREALQAAPFTARYHYLCAEAGCNGHEQSIVDWEIAGAARKWLRNNPPDVVKRMLRHKFLEEMCAPEKDTHFFVGNQHQHPGSFLVLGVFWPPKGSRPHPMLDL